jgi:hypothetical protein
MPDTGSGQFPYPNSSATPDVPADVLLLAQRIDLMASGWTLTATATTRAALVTNGDAYEGLRVYQIDTKATYIYQSAAWVTVDLPSVNLTGFSGSWIAGAEAPAIAIRAGVATFKGLATLSSGSVAIGASSAVLTIPAGYRPTADCHFPMMAQNENRFGWVAITTAGVVTLTNAAASPGTVTSVRLSPFTYLIA